MHRSNELAPVMCPGRWVTSLRGGLLACPPGASWFLGCFSESSRSKRLDKTPTPINEDAQRGLNEGVYDWEGDGRFSQNGDGSSTGSPSADVEATADTLLERYFIWYWCYLVLTLSHTFWSILLCRCPTSRPSGHHRQPVRMLAFHAASEMS